MYDGLRSVLKRVFSETVGRNQVATRGPQFTEEVSDRDDSQPRSNPPSSERASSSALRSAARVLARCAGSRSRDERTPTLAFSVLNGVNNSVASASSVLRGASMGTTSESDSSRMICWYWYVRRSCPK